MSKRTVYSKPKVERSTKNRTEVQRPRTTERERETTSTRNKKV